MIGLYYYLYTVAVDYLGHVLKQDEINAHAPQIMLYYVLQYRARAVYIIRALCSLL